MIDIILSDEQIEAMKPEIKKMEEAMLQRRPGMLLFQVWPYDKVMEGKFIQEELAKKLNIIIRS
jgi:hypothetical protein